MRALRVFCSPRATSSACTKDFPRVSREAYRYSPLSVRILKTFEFSSVQACFLIEKSTVGSRYNHNDIQAIHGRQQDSGAQRCESINGAKAIKKLCTNEKEKEKKMEQFLPKACQAEARNVFPRLFFTIYSYRLFLKVRNACGCNVLRRRSRLTY